jgi:hypothetical protein
MDNLRTAGCDTAQGFLFFRPEPPEVVEQLFAGAQAAAEAGIVCAGSVEGTVPVEMGSAPVEVGSAPVERVPAPVHSAARSRRLIPPASVPGARRRLARSSLVAGFKAMAHTWANGEHGA